MITTLKNDMLSGLILGIFALGWMDTLWIFGVENSQWYTWWGLIYTLGNKKFDSIGASLSTHHNQSNQ